MAIALVSLLVTLYQANGTFSFWQNWLLNFATYALYWNANLAVNHYFNRRYQQRPTATARLGWLFGAYLVNGVLASLANLALRNALGHAGPWTDGSALRLLFVETTVPMLLVMGFYESAHFLSAWRQAALRTVNLERESAISYLEALEQQVEPHFLFNSLNTMAALVGDNESAQELLGALASVYRYVLMSRNLPSVPLSQELAFVDNYLQFAALQIKHSAGDSAARAGQLVGLARAAHRGAAAARTTPEVPSRPAQPAAPSDAAGGRRVPDN